MSCCNHTFKATVSRTPLPPGGVRSVLLQSSHIHKSLEDPAFIAAFPMFEFLTQSERPAHIERAYAGVVLGLPAEVRKKFKDYFGIKAMIISTYPITGGTQTQSV